MTTKVKKTRLDIRSQFTWSGSANTFTVTDALCTEDSCINIYPKTAPAGNVTVEAHDGQFVVTTTASDED